MRRRTHERLYVRQGQAYRWEIDAARKDTQEARDRLRRFADELVPHATVDRRWDGEVLVCLRVDRSLVERGLPHEIAAFLTQRIMEVMLTPGLPDARGDLRQEQRGVTIPMRL